MGEMPLLVTARTTAALPAACRLRRWIGRTRRFLFMVGLSGALLLSGGAPCFALSITFNDLGGFGGGSSESAALREAAALWEGVLFDRVTVNINVEGTDLGSIDPGNKTLAPLAQTTLRAFEFPYSDVREKLIQGRTSQTDVFAVNSLEKESIKSFNFIVDPVPSRVQDDQAGIGARLFHGGTTPLEQAVGFKGDSRLETKLAVPNANARALGLLGAHDGRSDATIQFNNNSSVSFDFNRLDHITPGQFDLVAVATHEIGHALGFASGVDMIDGLICDKAPTPCGIDVFGIGALRNLVVFSPLDLYRYSPVSHELGRQFGLPVRDLTVTGEIPFRSSTYNRFFSLDQGNTPLEDFSTGRFNGDGHQASHWSDGTQALMRPAFFRGEFVSNLLHSSDLLAFDAIGWDLVARTYGAPEPSTVLIFGMGFVGLVLWRWRKQKIEKETN